MGTANRTRRTQLYSQDRDYGLYTIDIEATDMKRGSTGGIEVTTEMTVQELSQHDESTSQRRLVMQLYLYAVMFVQVFFFFSSKCSPIYFIYSA